MKICFNIVNPDIFSHIRQNASLTGPKKCIFWTCCLEKCSVEASRKADYVEKGVPFWRHFIYSRFWLLPNPPPTVISMRSGSKTRVPTRVGWRVSPLRLLRNLSDLELLSISDTSRCRAFTEIPLCGVMSRCKYPYEKVSLQKLNG